MMTRHTLIAATVLPVLLAASAPAAPPLADRLPADTLAYAGWSGLKSPPPLLETLLGVEGAPSPMLKALLDKAPPERRPLIEHGLAIGRIVLGRPAAVALLDVRAGKDGAPPVASAALLIGLGERRAAFAEHLEAALKAAGEELAFQELTVGEVALRTMPTPAGPLAFGYVKDTFLLALGEGVPKAVIEQDPAKALAGQALFAKATSQVAGQQVLLCGFVNSAAANARLGPLFDAEMGKQGERIRFAPLLEALGVGKTQAVAAALNATDGGLHLKARIFSPAPHTGLLMPFTGRLLTDRDLADVPADADLLAAANVSAADLLKELRRVVTAIDPNKGAELERGLRQAVLPGGVSVVDDLIASLGETWVLSSARSQGGFLTGTLLSVSVKDEARLKAALARVARALPPGGPPARRDHDDADDEPDSPRAAPAIRTVRRGELEVQYLSLAMPLPFAPAWAVHKGRLYVAGWPQIIQSAVENAGAEPLAASPAFLRARRGLSAEPSMLLYANTPKLLAEMYPTMLVLWSMACNALRQEWGGLELAVDRLPPLSRLVRDVQPEITGIWADEEGITFESRGTVPALGAMPAAPAMAISLLMPSLARARFAAKKASSSANLKTIGMAVHMYAASNRGRFPPDLAALAKGGYLGGDSLNVLVSPLSGRPPPKLADGKLVGEVDYVYILLPWDAPAERIMAYERPENHRGEGTIVLFADGHVERVDKARFQALLKETQDWLKEQK